MSLYSVSLVDRRTGRQQRVNGAPHALVTRDPQEAERELLRNRDAHLWEVRISLLHTFPGAARHQ